MRRTPSRRAEAEIQMKNREQALLQWLMVIPALMLAGAMLWIWFSILPTFSG
jgi:hypothetical protein